MATAACSRLLYSETSKTTISHLLSAPISIIFHELHEAIETVFAWDPVHARYGEGARYGFNVVEGTPLKVEQVGSLLELQYAWERSKIRADLGLDKGHNARNLLQLQLS